MSDIQQFASDNYAGICPQAWAAMEAANRGHAPAYGEDPWTQAAADAFRALFATDCEVFFAFNGTAANSMALAALCQSYHSVICAESAHVETDECGAPEFFSNGSKLLVAPSPDGKLTPARTYWLRHTTREVKAKVAAIAHRVDINTLSKDAASTLAMNDIAQLSLKLAQPIFADNYTDSRATGAFILIDESTNNTVGAGMIIG